MLKFLLIYNVFSVKNRTMRGAMAPASPPIGSVPDHRRISDSLMDVQIPSITSLFVRLMAGADLF
jgi:hypothetical protein